jgi:uncharacterized protein YjiS (DUF1127 family)
MEDRAMNGVLASRFGALRLPRRGRAQGLLGRALDQIFLWQERAASRRALGALDDRMLHDVGIDRATAHREAGRPFWDGR